MKRILAAAITVAALAVPASALAAPSAPTNLHIAVVGRDDVLTWTAAPKAASYRIDIADSTINVRDPHTVFSSDNVGLATSLDLGPVFTFSYSDCGLTSEIDYSVSSADAHGNLSNTSADLSIFPGCS